METNNRISVDLVNYDKPEIEEINFFSYIEQLVIQIFEIIGSVFKAIYEALPSWDHTTTVEEIRIDRKEVEIPPQPISKEVVIPQPKPKAVMKPLPVKLQKAVQDVKKVAEAKPVSKLNTLGKVALTIVGFTIMGFGVSYLLQYYNDQVMTIEGNGTLSNVENNISQTPLQKIIPIVPKVINKTVSNILESPSVHKGEEFILNVSNTTISKLSQMAHNIPVSTWPAIGLFITLAGSAYNFWDSREVEDLKPKMENEIVPVQEQTEGISEEINELQELPETILHEEEETPMKEKTYRPEHISNLQEALKRYVADEPWEDDWDVKEEEQSVENVVPVTDNDNSLPLDDDLPPPDDLPPVFVEPEVATLSESQELPSPPPEEEPVEGLPFSNKDLESAKNRLKKPVAAAPASPSDNTPMGILKKELEKKRAFLGGENDFDVGDEW